MRNIFYIFISAITLFFVFNLSNINIKELQIINYKSLFIVLFFSIISIILISIRLYLIINQFRNVAFKKLFSFSLVSFVFNILSFSGSGEVIKYFFLAKDFKNSQQNIVAIFFLEKTFSFLSLLFIFSIVPLVYLNVKIAPFQMLIFFSLLIFIFKKRFFFKKIPYVNHLDYSIRRIQKTSIFFMVFFTSFLIHAIYFVQIYFLLFFIFNVEISNIQLILVITIILFSNTIPLTFSGFGAREFAVFITSLFLVFDVKGLLNMTLSLGVSNLIIASIILIIISIHFKYFKRASFFKSLFKGEIVNGNK